METLEIIQLSPDELEDIIEKAVTKALDNRDPSSPERKEEYLSRKETKNLLRISYPTLNKRSKEGKLQSYKIGGRVLYKQSEIEEAISPVKNQKYRRD